MLAWLLAAAVALVGDFSLMTSSGAAFTQDNVKGKVWVAYNFFTACKTSCPLSTYKAGQLVKEFGADPDFLVVGITTDPKNDTTEKLASFAKTAKADPAHWLFATGSVDQLKTLAATYFKIGFDPPRDGLHGGHSSLFVLVDRDRTIKGFYYSGEHDAFSRLKADVRTLLGARK